MLNIGVLISGGGTNLQAIIDETKSGGINGTVKLVISNKENAYGLERARLSKIKAVYETDEDKIIELLKENNIDLIVLAGYLKIITPKFVDEFRNKIQPKDNPRSFAEYGADWLKQQLQPDLA